MEQCILVIFINSLMSSDVEIMKELDNFKYIISNGSIVKKVKNHYPNLKNSVTTTILTGELPYKHGIYLNDLNVKVRNYRHKEYEDIRVPTILDLFKENNNNVSLISWPNMGYSDFKFNFSEINSVKMKDIFRGIVKGSSFYMLKNIYKYINILKIGIQPEEDNFSSILAMELLESKKSNVIFLTFNHLDYVRRRYGLNYEYSVNALKSIDRKIGDLIVWCDNKNILNNMTLSIVSGGAPYECRNIINLNYIFIKNDLLTINKKGRILNYIAYAHCEGGSAFIYLKNPNNINDYGKVKVFLEDIVKKYSKYIKCVYETSDYEKFNLNEFSFRLEAKSNSIFDEKLNTTNFVEEASLSNYASFKVNKCFYGYSGDYNNSNGVFINYGNKIRRGIEINECDIVDIAPTIASFGNLDFISSGRVIKNILEEH